MSVSNQAKRRGVILDEIMRYHREQLPQMMRDVPIADLRALASVAPPALDFGAALARPGVTLIAECKKASPSKGLIAPRYDPVRFAREYVRGGAGAISVLTDARHFQGSLADLRDVKEAVGTVASLVPDKQDPRRRLGIPVLRKDFIFDPYQLYEARAAGADAVLLIAAVLAPAELANLIQQAARLGLASLVEVHSEAELDAVLPLAPPIIGVNNRNLQTFEVDFENTGRLRRRIPAGTLVVAESGIQGPDDVRRLKGLGVDAILVGESLIRSKDMLDATRKLVQAGRK
jgi:indole-3-glycerol phosphate synthase